MKRKKKWQAGRQMLALFMAVAFALSGLNIGAVQAASQDEVVVLDFLNGKSENMTGTVTLEGTGEDADYMLERRFDIPNGNILKTNAKQYSNLTFKATITVNSCSEGTPAVVAYAMDGNWENWKSTDTWSPIASVPMTKEISFDLSDYATLNCVAIRLAKMTEGANVDATITSAKIVGTSTSGGNSSEGTTAAAAVDGLKAELNPPLKSTTDWSEYNYKIENGTSSAVKGLKLIIPFSGTVKDLKSWNCSASLSGNTIIVKHTAEIAAGAIFSCTENQKFGFGGGAVLGTPTVELLTEEDTASGLKYTLTGETKDVAYADTPVGKHGALNLASVSGYSAPIIVDQSGNPMQLRGASTHGLQWSEMRPYVNKDSFQSLRDEWGVNMVRLVNYVTQGGYTQGSQSIMDETTQKGVEIAKELGMYAIVDWHIHAESPLTTKAQAAEFFKNYATMYKDYDNVIFEICNEPTGVEWYNGSGNDLYTYCKEIAKVIRDCGSNALIICGTNTWSQDVDDVAKKPLKDDGFENIMYTFHFYSGSHYDDKMNKVKTATSAGTPIFVTEFGICDASGNGGYDTGNADAWIKLLDSYNISYACWSLCNKNESASYLLPSCGKTTGGWVASDLSTTGIWLVNTYRSREAAEQEKENPDKVTGVTLDKTKLQLQIGESAELTPTVKPDTALDKTVRFSTSDKTVVTVDEAGLVKAVGAGTAKITVTTTDGKKTAVCAVTVTKKKYENPPAAPEISSYTSNTITVTKKEDVEYGISTDGKTYEWQTDNVFTGLSSYTKHFVACRYPQTASYTASEASKPAVVTTYFDEADCKKIDLSKLADKTYVEAHDGTITYDEKTKTVTLVSEKADQSYTITGENSDVTIKSAGAQVDLNNASVKRVESEEHITVTITGNNVVADGINSAKDVTIKTKEDANASLDVSSGAEAAISGENVTVESGKLTATGKNLPAIKADKTVTIAGGTVKANVTGDAEELPAAVTAATIKITNGAVESDNKNVFSTEPEDESGSKIKFVTITYKADGEESVVAKVAKNAEYILPTPEEKKGYQAKGWTLAGDETEKVYQIGEKITASENMVFEAVYEKITGTLEITVKDPAEDLTYGYTVDEGIVVTVQNNANVAVNNITVSLSSEEDFTIASGDTTIKTLDPGKSTQFTVTLKNKKSAGTYKVTFTASATNFNSDAQLTRVVKEAQKEDPDDTKGDNKEDPDDTKGDNKQDQDNKKDDNKQDQGDQKGDDNKQDQGDQKGDDNKQDQTNPKPDDTKKPDTAASTTTAAAPTTESSPAASTTEDVEEDLFTPELACTNVLMQKGKSTKLTTNGSGVKITSVKYANAKSKKIVKATSSGKLKALKTGKAILRVTYEYEGEAYTEKVTVKVIKTPVVVLTKKSMSVKLAKGKTAMIVQSDDMFATKDMKFRSSNSKVVKVTSKGQIKALKKKKSAVIKITIDDEEYKVKVTVK